MLVSRSTIPVLPLLIVATGVVGAVLLVIAYPGSDTEAGFAGNQCHGLPVTDTRPGQGNDNLAGTSGDDVVDLQEGNDAYDGGGGNDTIRGGKGNDDLDGQGRSDDVFGNKGSDDVSGAVAIAI